MLNKKDLLIYNFTHISMNPGSNILSDDAENQKETNMIKYQKIIKKLIYLACETRFDIAYAVKHLNQYCGNPKTVYAKVVRRVLRYFRGTINMIIIYGDVNDIRTKLKIRSKELYNYADNNYARDIINRKLIIKYAFMLNGNIIV